MAEPVVIPIKDGETVTARSREVEIRDGTTKGAFRIQPVCSFSDCVRLETLEGVFLANVAMATDPDRAAELKERERIRAGIRTACEHHDADPALVEDLVSALDAPAEPSDAELRGGQSTIEGLTLQLAEQTARIELLEGQLDTRTQQLDGCRVELDRERERVTPHPIGGWAEQIRALRQEVCNLVAERAATVASLAKRSEEFAACREELDVTRDELATVLGEGDALKVERDKLRGEAQSAVNTLTLYREAERPCPIAPALIGTIMGLQAALEPKA